MVKEMFRRLLLGFGVIGAIALLSACQTVAPTAPVVVAPPVATAPVTTAEKVQTVITQVQDRAAQVCNFVPAASTVGAIIGAFTGQGDLIRVVSSTANSICQAVTTKSAVSTGDTAPRRAARRSSAPEPLGSVNGVPIKGEFVK